MSEVERGSVHAFVIRPDGALASVGSQPSGGEAPCHLAIDAGGRWLLAANYWSATVAVFPVDESGAIGPAAHIVRHAGSGPTPRQRGPHPHCVRTGPDDRHALIADLGIDKVVVYGLDPESGRLDPNANGSASVPAGHGPRMLDFHPNGRVLYLLNELTSTIVALSYDSESGGLEPIHTVSTLPDGWRGDSTAAHLVVHPGGRFLYASNRGHDSIAIFDMLADGRLSPIGHVQSGGRTPRAFALSPDGRFLLAANQHSGTVVTFSIDPGTGRIAEAGRFELPWCVCLTFSSASS